LERIKHNLENPSITLYLGVFLILFSAIFLYLDSLGSKRKEILLIETIMVGILFSLASILKPKKSENNSEPQNKAKTTEPIDNNKIKNFLRVKNSLLSFYQNIASAQAVRLIGFTAGVFTLIGATQISPKQHLSEVFSEAVISPLIGGISLAISSNIKFLIFFGSICILFFFIFRAIFRYASYSYLASALTHLSIVETEKAEGNSLHEQINNALFEHVKKYPRRVFKIPIFYFISYTKNTKIRWGTALSCFLSILATFLILLLFW
jgi:hypothetical protein